MRIIKGLLQDKAVNDILVAVIIGFSTVLFINNVVTAATERFGRSFSNPGLVSSFPWRTVLVQVAVYIVCIFIALFTRMQLNTKANKR